MEDLVKYLILAFALFFAIGNGSAVQADEPTRAAFYYAWYPENWSEGHVWDSVSGEYDSATIAATHVAQMEYANIDAGIYSWWGKNSPTDERFETYLDAGLKWAIYYEIDQQGTRWQWFIDQDLKYLQDHYFNHPNYLRVNGKPVVYVYSPGGSCSSVAKWALLRAKYNLYVSMTDVPNWWTCNTLDSWHAYRPDNRVNSVYLGSTLYSVSISAGFWAAWEDTPRLERDFTAWQNAVAGVQPYNFPWQLYYFNEFGEGTNIEPSTAQCEAYMCADYLITLHEAPAATRRDRDVVRGVRQSN